jgi:predicted ATP-binding protein involved in virulence
VENYKNIKDCNFNFASPILYKFKNEKITETDNEGFIKNLYDENINISAIVGSNGTGKSTVFEIIAKIQSRVIDEDLEQGLICIFKESTGIKVYSNTDIKNRTFSPLTDLYSKFPIIYNSNNFNNGYFDNLKDNFSTPIFDVFGSDSSFLYVQTMLNLVINSNRYLVPKISDAIHRQKDAFIISEMNRNYKNAKTISILEFLDKNATLLPFKFEDDIKIVFSIQINPTTNNINTKNYKDTIIEFFRLEEEFDSEEDGDNQEYKEKLRKYKESLEEFKTFLDKYNLDTKPESDTVCFKLNNAIKFVNLYKALYKNNPNLKASLFDIQFRNLSSGEESLILTYSLLANSLNAIGLSANNSNDIIIMLDEIENSLHPKWQQKLILYIRDFLKNMGDIIAAEHQKRFNFHVILASHSPFIISDIPKQNIIFLDKNDDNKCKVGDGLKDKKKTFASNINTLLSDSFFMEDSFVGKFAESKIKEIVGFDLEKNISSSEEEKNKILVEFKKIQDYIGDDYLSNIIGNHIEKIERELFPDTYSKRHLVRQIEALGIENVKEYLEEKND